jgi:hypothetical protein
MNSTITVSVGVTLLALAAGMFLLAKAAKDNLSLIYKIAAWFIIIAGILNLGCSALHCMMNMYGKHMHYEMMMEKKMNKGMHRHMNEMWYGHENDGIGCESGRCSGNERHFCSINEKMNCKESDDYWKKCYEHLKDSCNIKNK